MKAHETTTGIALSGIVPLRKHPSDASEMVSQLLIGEVFNILRKKSGWLLVQSVFDEYEGWMNKNECYILNHHEAEKWLSLARQTLNRSPYYLFRVFGQNREACLIPTGAVINKSSNKLEFPFGTYHIKEQPRRIKADTLINTAINFLGTPYLWGGRSDTGIDCSGFVQTVLLLHGIHYPRDSSKQALALPLYNDDLVKMDEGDIIYFNPRSSKISHVGFYLGEGLLLHASGRVRIENISQEKRFLYAYGRNEILAESIAGYQKINDIQTVYRNKSSGRAGPGFKLETER